jgi:hypothetical protein
LHQWAGREEAAKIILSDYISKFGKKQLKLPESRKSWITDCEIAMLMLDGCERNLT